MTRHPMGHVRKDCRGLGAAAAVVVVVGRGGAAAAGDAGGVGDE